MSISQILAATITSRLKDLVIDSPVNAETVLLNLIDDAMAQVRAEPRAFPGDEGMARAITAGLLDKQGNGKTAIENLMTGYSHHPKTVEEEIVKEVQTTLRMLTPSSEIHYAELRYSNPSMSSNIHACEKCGMPGATMHFPGGYLCPGGCQEGWPPK